MTITPDIPTIDYAAVLRRRRWSLIVPIVLATAVGVALAVLLPREYEATATLAVSSPGISTSLTPQTPQDLAERVRAISHGLLSQAVVEEVARDERLLDEAPLDEVVADLRRRTTLAVPPRPLSTAGRSEPDTFIVSHTNRTPELAERVTNRLLQVFIQTQSKSRETRAEDTSAFLDRQLALSRERLEAAEARLREVKARYQGQLPEQALLNLQRLGELRHESETNRTAIQSERERVLALDRQIEAAQQDAASAAQVELDRASEARLADLTQQLATARQVYTARHPEVERLERELAAARAEDEVERRRAAAGAKTAPTDPAYRQMTTDRESAVMRQRDLEAAGRRIQDQLTVYQGRLDETPLVEQRVAALAREHDVERERYQKLADQHQAALLREDLERRNAGEQFVVLYPAQRPQAPVSPNIPLVLGAALVAGVIVGGALAFGREFADRTIHDAHTLQQTYQRVVLEEVPRF
jgi:polysaccharide chain length determinant protein (PEP-CTERM system associated)